MKNGLVKIKNIISWVIFGIAAIMMIFTLVSVLTFNRMDRSIFGYKAFVVMSDSMSATDFKAGDLILSKEVDPSTLQEGDIISFQSTNPDDSYGKVITHKIRSVTKDKDGLPCFVTYGTTTNTDDENPVYYNFVMGKYKIRFAGIGKFFLFLKTTPGYIICIFVPFLLLIIIQGISNVVLFRKYKREQMEQINAEKQQLSEQLAEAQKMLDELLLKKEKQEKQEDVSQSKSQ